MGNVSPKPGFILVPVATDLLAELGEWSPPVEARVEEDGDTWSMTFRHSTALSDIRQQVQDLAHRFDHLDPTSPEWTTDLDEIRLALHRLARGGT